MPDEYSNQAALVYSTRVTSRRDYISIFVIITVLVQCKKQN